MTAIIPAPAFPLAAEAPDVSRLVMSWLDSRSPRTKIEYTQDLATYARFLCVPPKDAAHFLMTAGPAAANKSVLDFQTWLGAQGNASATVNRRVAALKSFVRLMVRIGGCPYRLDVEPIRSESYRDVRGPRWEVFEAALARETSVSSRAILALLGLQALRRAEVASLTVASLDLPAERFSLAGKGKRGEARWYTMSPRTRKILEAWLKVRGMEPGSLFDVSGATIGRICGRHGFRAHSLRHCAISQCYRMTRDIHKTMIFARHASIAVTQKYVDQFEDEGGQGARAVSGDGEAD